MTQEQIAEKVAAYKANGCKLSDDKIIALIMRSAKNAAKNARNAAKGFARREQYAGTQAGNLWGPGQKYSTQAEYQRSLLGKDWN